MKDRIKEKAQSLFMQFGARSITMDEIALQMGVSKKTIYHYFEDKDSLVDAVMQDIIHCNQECCLQDKAAAKDAIHEIFLALKMMQEMFQNMNPIVLFELEKFYPKSFQKFKEHKFKFLYKIIKENLERGIAEELYRKDINTDIMIALRLVTMTLPFDTTVFPNNQYNHLQVQTELSTHFLYGLATIKGFKLIEKYQKQQQLNKKIKKDEKIMA